MAKTFRFCPGWVEKFTLKPEFTIVNEDFKVNFSARDGRNMDVSIMGGRVNILLINLWYTYHKNERKALGGCSENQNRSDQGFGRVNSR